ncbi:glycosyl transferase [Candidatus Peregrinibacteria bacterium CG_4_10_14_0_2_um_filter_43_11]|nr:MAG: glycosyl transferase [Candidatus Peregrinibacteria bacterium CG_4_10_14_0_2_um_filter_43_11]
MHSKISCIVPVYNEARRVGVVLSLLIKHPLIDEVIVINDGSSDDSEAVLKKIEGIRLISYPKNQGKTLAMKLGFEAASYPLIMMIDSDLIGLSEKALTELIEPVKNGIADVSMSLRKNSLRIFKWFGLDFVSGERVFDRGLLGDLEVLKALPPFGLEVFLNDLIVQKNLRIKVVDWKEVITPRKSTKYGFFIGIFGDLKMIAEIIKVMGVSGIVRQFRKMCNLKV